MDFLGFVLAVIALFLLRRKQGQIDALRQRLTQLEYRVTDLRDGVAPQAGEAPADAAMASSQREANPESPPESAEATPASEPQPDDAPLPPESEPAPAWGPWAEAARGAASDTGAATAPGPARPRFDIERAMGVQLPVWGGAIMLLVAGFFLARMAADNGFFTPTLGVLASALGGLVMLGGAALVSARQIANHRQIGAALASAAIGTFYATAFMASAAFGLTSLFTGFLLSAATAAIAMPIALRFGQPVLGVGLLGGYLAPFFLLQVAPSQLLINCYLAALLASAALTAARKGWWRMLVAAIVVHFVWLAALTLANSVPGVREASTLVALVLTPVALFALWNRTEDLRTAHPHLGWLGAAFSAACLIGGAYLTDFEVPHLVAIAALFVASAGMIHLDRTRTIYPSLGALAAWLVLLLVWRDPEPFARLALVGVALASIGLPLALKLWAGQQARRAAIGLSLLGMGSFVTSMVDLDGWGGMRDLPILWALLALGAAALSVLALRLFAPRAPEAEQPFIRAIFAASASAFLSLAIVAVVDPNYFALAAALQVLGLAVVFRRYGVESLLTLAGVYFGLYFVLLAISTTIAWMLVGARGIADYLPALWPDDAPVVTLILPALAFLGAATLVPRGNHLAKALDFGGLILLAAGISLVILPDLASLEPIDTLIWTSLLSNPILLLGLGAIVFGHRLQRSGLSAAGLVIGIGMLALVLVGAGFQAYELWPVWRVPGWPLLNVTLSGLVVPGMIGLLIALALRMMPQHWPLRWGAALAGAFLVVTGVLVDIRALFHPDLLQGESGAYERHAYTAAMLALAAAALILGARFNSQPLRYGSLAILLAAVAKVFLFDASGLEGLWRVGSFVTMGVALLATSWFYGRFVFAGMRRAEPEKS